MNTATAPTRVRRPRVGRLVSGEMTGGLLLLGAAAVGLAWANSPWRDGYTALSQTVVGPASWHLDLTLETWATDGLLALFFFVVGLELKQELVAGSLRDVRSAAVPALAAVGGMALPAGIFALVTTLAGDHEALHGWAIPTATDIAFALAVLAVFGRGLPSALRTFLLTLAVVDDLLAIVVIAVFYTEHLNLAYLAGGLAGVLLFALAARAPRFTLVALPVIALATWGLVHASGVHSTIAGAMLGLVVPATRLRSEPMARATRYERALRPWSTSVALPVFAFFAAGVSLVDGAGAGAIVWQPVVLAVVVGLTLGKLVGALGVTALVTRLTPLRLPQGIGMRDLLPVGLLAGIGFTVALLVAELSFPDGTHTEGAKAAVLAGSVLSAIGAAITLRLDAARTRPADINRDGVPDDVTDRIGDEDDES